MLIAALKTIWMVKFYYQLDVDVRLVIVNMEHHAHVDEVGPGEFEIEASAGFLDQATEDEVVKLIAHEMVHVKQHVKEGLDVTNCIWKGQQYEPNYWFAPWEIEARGLEEAFLHYYHENTLGVESNVL